MLGHVVKMFLNAIVVISCGFFDIICHELGPFLFIIDFILFIVVTLVNMNNSQHYVFVSREDHRLVCVASYNVLCSAVVGVKIGGNQCLSPSQKVYLYDAESKYGESRPSSSSIQCKRFSSWSTSMANDTITKLVWRPRRITMAG